jgi:hypothetical protein
MDNFQMFLCRNMLYMNACCTCATCIFKYTVHVKNMNIKILKDLSYTNKIFTSKTLTQTQSFYYKLTINLFIHVLCFLKAHIPKTIVSFLSSQKGSQNYTVSSPSPHPQCIKRQSRLYCVFSKPTSPLDEGENTRHE